MLGLQFDFIMDYALWTAGIGHLILPIAGLQVPICFCWREDLKSLMPINRHLMWIYGAFTLKVIIAFGLITLYCHDELLKSSRLSGALSLFISLFWITRMCVEWKYLPHSLWPKGWCYSMGHILLVLLFLYLTLVYGILAYLHLVIGS